jgi:tetratricopeptide (TPR) repeat protein
MYGPHDVRLGLPWLVAAVSLVLVGVASADVRPYSDDFDLNCGPPPPGHPVKGRRDYRLMGTNPKDQRDLRYHQTYHIAPARQQIASGGDLSWNVMNNLHFVLHKVPNDARALDLLIKWDAAGGRDQRYAPPVCYFTWARQFAPDDPTVWNYGGYYFYRNGDRERALRWWEEAIAIDPDNAEAHYNLGVMMVDEGRFADARSHAWAAYAAGYPLQGLREKLLRAGQWQDPPPHTD